MDSLILEDNSENSDTNGQQVDRCSLMDGRRIGPMPRGVTLNDRNNALKYEI